MLKAIHTRENKDATCIKAQAVVKQLREMKFTAAAKKIETGIDETLTYMNFPDQHWNKIRTTNLIERVNREIKRRTRSIGIFPDGQSALSVPDFVMCPEQTGERNAASTWSTCLNRKRRGVSNRKVPVDLFITEGISKFAKKY